MTGRWVQETLQLSRKSGAAARATHVNPERASFDPTGEAEEGESTRLGEKGAEVEGSPLE